MTPIATITALPRQSRLPRLDLRLDDALLLRLPLPNLTSRHGLGHLDGKLRRIAERARMTCVVFVLLRPNLQVALRTHRRGAALGEVRLSVVEETYRALLIGRIDSAVGTFQAGGQLAIADEAADCAGFPRSGRVEAGGLTSLVQLGPAQLE